MGLALGKASLRHFANLYLIYFYFKFYKFSEVCFKKQPKINDPYLNSNIGKI